MTRIATENRGAFVPAEQQYLHVTIAFAPFDQVLPAVAGLFRARYGFSRAIEDSRETLWARFDRMEPERRGGNDIQPLDAVRVIEPKETPGATIVEDHFGIDPDQLSALLPQVSFLTLTSEYHRKSAERHSYTWREKGKVRRHAHIHHNYQEPGWNWQTTGEPQPWEDADRIAAKRISKRCDRALMIAYAEKLGCQLHGPLAAQDWTRAITIFPIAEQDVSETPPPIDWGEDVRKRAVAAGFGRGEEGMSFEGMLADNHFLACLGAYVDETHAGIASTRSAKALLEVMQTRGTAPDWQDKDGVDGGLWTNALTRAYQRFPDAPEIPELERLAVKETRNYRFALNDLRLGNLRAGATGAPQELDMAMMAEILKGDLRP